MLEKLLAVLIGAGLIVGIVALFSFLFWGLVWLVLTWAFPTYVTIGFLKFWAVGFVVMLLFRSFKGSK